VNIVGRHCKVYKFLSLIGRLGGLIKRLNKPKKRLTKAFERAYCSPTYTGLIGK
jgi:hypothetical protein